MTHISTQGGLNRTEAEDASRGDKAEEGRERNKVPDRQRKAQEQRDKRCWVSVTWMCLAAARALRSSLRAAMPLKAAWMVTAEADSRVPLAPCKRGRHTLEAGAREVDKIWKL